MKKNDPIYEIEQCCKQIHDSAKRWNGIIQSGCSDPFWPDGVNLNLVRNHIIYARKRILELCDEYGIIQPDEASCEIPPKVPDNLYTGESGTDRFKRISAFHPNLIILDSTIPQYEPLPLGQTSLF